MSGEIVCDSILQNKEKTKTYWERLMLAAEAVSNQLGSEGFRGRSQGMRQEESVIERDIRMQKAREEALAQEREEALKLATKLGKEDEAFSSIPTTDEGNFSEYGSEEKEHSLDGSASRVMTPEVEFGHQRTPSFESMSSGHSSGSEFPRRSSVRPIDEPQILPSFARNQKETPIEREIRLTKEREEELRREKRNSANFSYIKPDIKAELSPVTLKKCVSLSSIPATVHRGGDHNPSLNKTPLSTNVRPVPTRSLSSNNGTPKLFIPNPNKKGVMKRFLESHGKMVPTFTFSPSPPANSTPTKSPDVGPVKKITEISQTDKPGNNSFIARRPGYRSAEDKIQTELEEMKRREAELRSLSNS